MQRYVQLLCNQLCAPSFIHGIAFNSCEIDKNQKGGGKAHHGPVLDYRL